MVSFDPALLMNLLAAVFWPFLRIGAMFMAAPIFGSASVPVRIRVLLALLLAWVVTPLVPAMPSVDPFSATGILVSLQQIAIGLAMGFLLQLAFSATVLAGQTIAMTMGLGFASMVDPESGIQVPVISQFLTIMTTLLFLGLDGHLLIIISLVESFRSLPVAVTLFSPDLLMNLVTFAGHVFLMALVIALPVVIAVLIVNLSLGVVTRAAPQLNIFAVGFPVTILVGLFVMFLSLGVMQTGVLQLFDDTFELLAAMVG